MSTLRSLTHRFLSVLQTQPAVAQKVRRRSVVAATLLTLFTVSFFGFHWYRDNYLPLPKQPIRQPDPLIVGGPDAAVQRTYKVIELLRAAQWDFDKVSLADLRLPDARYAESASLRNPWATTYCTPNRPDGDPRNEPVYKDVACFTDLYARSNPTYYRGDRAKFKPEGYYIVGWKDGRVTKVPIGDIRWNSGVKEKVVLSFPGMPNYDPRGYRLSFVEFADHTPTKAEYRAYAAAVHQQLCETCSK